MKFCETNASFFLSLQLGFAAPSYNNAQTAIKTYSQIAIQQLGNKEIRQRVKGERASGQYANRISKYSVRQV